jgi:hypothetical protein
MSVDVTNVYALLGPVVQAASARVEVGLGRAFADLDALPLVFVVAGRIGTGKSAWINRVLAGAGAPTGLGGRTRERRLYQGSGLAFWDLPGRDGESLEPETWPSEVDGVVWVTDALQPWGAEERRAAREVQLPTWVVLGRLDLVDPEERGEVVARVRNLAPMARAVEASDAPDWAVKLRSLRGLESPRRRASLRHALALTGQALEHLPLAPDPAEIVSERAERARAQVERARRSVEARIRSGELVFGDAVRRAFELTLGDTEGSPSNPGVWRQLGELARGTPGLVADLTVLAAERAYHDELAARAWLDGPEGAAALALRAEDVGLRERLRSLVSALDVMGQP